MLAYRRRFQEVAADQKDRSRGALQRLLRFECPLSTWLKPVLIEPEARALDAGRKVIQFQRSYPVLILMGVADKNQMPIIGTALFGPDDDPR